jgi:hypothetical protein
MKRIIPVLLLLSFVTSSCHFMHHTERGDGNVVKEDRRVETFKGVDVSGGIEVIITQDSAYSVKVEIDKNLQEFIEVYTDDNVLRIHQKNNTSLDATGDIKVYVSAPLYKELSASGACGFTSTGKIASEEGLNIDMSGASWAKLDVRAPSVTVSTSGACSVTLKGEAKDFKVDGTGSSDFNCFDLLTENADIDLSGAGNAEVTASVKLNATCTGAADVRYKGSPAVSSDVSGAGTVKPAQ